MPEPLAGGDVSRGDMAERDPRAIIAEAIEEWFTFEAPEHKTSECGAVNVIEWLSEEGYSIYRLSDISPLLTREFAATRKHEDLVVASLRRVTAMLAGFVDEHRDPGAEAFGALFEARQLLSRSAVPDELALDQPRDIRPNSAHETSASTSASTGGT